LKPGTAFRLHGEGSVSSHLSPSLGVGTSEFWSHDPSAQVTSLGREGWPVCSLPRWADALLRFLPRMLVLVFFASVLFEASVLPYRYWDAMAFGTWSREIADRGQWWPSFDSLASRPLFYVGQGLLWLVFGDHEWLGRWLSALFALVFVLCVVWLGGRVASNGARSLVRVYACAIALCSAVLAALAAAGMSDVPVAAAAVLTAVVIWSRRLGRLRVPLAALAAAATALAKPTGYLALLGLALACLLSLRALEQRRRALGSLAGLAAGAGLGLVYDGFMAAHFRESISSFVGSGNTAYYRSRAAGQRWDAVLRADWFGAEIRLAVVFGLVYAVVRAAGGRGRTAAAVAAPVAIAWSLAGPAIADGGTPYPFANGLSLGLIAWLGLAAAIAATPFLPHTDVLNRRMFVALALWALPGAAAWLVSRPDEVRFLSPIWAPIVLMTAAALASTTLSLARRSAPAAAVPVLAASLLVIANLVNVDGLGGSRWHHLLRLGWSGWTNSEQTEHYAYAQFFYELEAARANLADGERLISSDSRLPYFFPDRVDVQYAQSCGELRGHRVFVLLTDRASTDIMKRLYGSSADPLAWLQCPHLYEVSEEPGANATFVVGTPPSLAPDPSACHISSYGGQLKDAVFADSVGYAEAKRVAVQAAQVGFRSAKIEQTGCSTFHVVVTGVPDEAKTGFTKEAASVGFRVKIAPALRYPQVPVDVPPMR
jgi:4-amino-4-deoxy-L-arabinose transferase-like glycosyltransferase